MSDTSERLVPADTGLGPGSVRLGLTWKDRLVGEMKQLAAMLIYLWVLFGLIALSQYVGSMDRHIEYRFYGAALINALLLVKILLLAEDFGFARRFEDKPLAYAILYRSFAFAVLLVAFYLVEEIGIGAWRGKTVAESAPHFATSAGEIMAVTAMMFIGLIPFSAYTELGRLIGMKTLSQLFLAHRPPA